MNENEIILTEEENNITEDIVALDPEIEVVDDTMDTNDGSSLGAIGIGIFAGVGVAVVATAVVKGTKKAVKWGVNKLKSKLNKAEECNEETVEEVTDEKTEEVKETKVKKSEKPKAKKG